MLPYKHYVKASNSEQSKLLKRKIKNEKNSKKKFDPEMGSCS